MASWERACCFEFTFAQNWHLAELYFTRRCSLGVTYLGLGNSECFVDPGSEAWWTSVPRVLSVASRRMILPSGGLHQPDRLSCPFLLHHGVSGSTMFVKCHQNINRSRWSEDCLSGSQVNSLCQWGNKEYIFQIQDPVHLYLWMNQTRELKAPCFLLSRRSMFQGDSQGSWMSVSLSRQYGRQQFPPFVTRVSGSSLIWTEVV